MLDFKSLNPVQCMAASLFFRHKRLLLILPRQEGKTELGVRLLHSVTSEPTPSSSLFLAKNFASGKKATDEKFRRLFSKSVFEVNTEKVYLKENPSSVIFMGSVDKDHDSQRGGTYHVIHWSEVAFSKIERGETILGVYGKVVQPTIRKTDGYVLLESTNNGKNGWWDLWENYKENGFARLKIALSDMVYLGLVSVEEYEAIQKSTHPDIFSQEYECNFVSFQGKAYREFNESHVQPVPPPEPWQKVIAAIDWGYSPSATAILYGYVKDEILFIFDEHYEFEEMPAITAQKLERTLQKWNVTNVAIVADHEADRIQELRMRNIPCGLADKTNVLGARTQIKEMFYFDKIVIDPKCTNLRRDLDVAVWDAKKDGELDYSNSIKGHLDCEAALRYLVRELSNVEEDKPIINPHKDSASQAMWDIRMRRQLNNGDD